MTNSTGIVISHDIPKEEVMEESLKRTVNEIVKEDMRTAEVFEKYAIDFCCNGGRTLEAACEEKGLDPKPVLRDLTALEKTKDASSLNADTWDLDVLAAHIMNTHHEYVRRMLPIIQNHLAKVLSVHGNAHPELAEVNAHFRAVAQELTSHMHKEEMVLFPYIKALVAATNRDVPPPAPAFGSIRNPIRMMELEHQSAGDAFTAIRLACNEYVPPQDACTTLTLTYSELASFERDLHKHIHLENAILFPKAIRMEERLRQ